MSKKKRMVSPFNHTDVAVFMETFPAASETWNWSVVKGLIGRGYTVQTVAASEGDWAAIGGREAFLGTAYVPRKIRSRLASEKVKRISELLGAGVTLAASSPKVAFRLQRQYPIQTSKGAAALWTHSFLRNTLPRPVLSHGLFGLSARRALMLRSVGIIEGPIVGTFGGFDINIVAKREGSTYFSEFYEKVDRIIAVSEFIKRQLIADGAPEERVDVVYYGVDLEHFAYREPSVSAEEVTFVAVGRLIECKGIRYAIDAFARLLEKHPSAKLKIIGDGPLMASLREQATRMLPFSSYAFLGMISHEEVYRELAASDVLLAPGVVGSDGAEEALGGSVIEAHAVGLPVICSSVGGLPEAMKDGESGIVVQPNDVVTLCAAMEKMIIDRKMWPAMSRSGRRHIEKNFSAEGYLDKLEEVYARAWNNYQQAV